MTTIVYNYSRVCHFKANVKKCAVVVFFKLGDISQKWFGGDEAFPVLDYYCYFVIMIRSNGSWDKRIKSLVICNKQKLGGLHRVMHNFALDF